MPLVFTTCPAGTEEHEELVRALRLIKDTIMQVDSHVDDYEKAQRLRDISAKLEPKSLGRMKDGRVFRREDILTGGRRLLHEGTVSCRASSGRLKGVEIMFGITYEKMLVGGDGCKQFE